MKALKIIGAILLGLVGLVVLLYVIGVAVNWRDQPPSAAALEMKAILADRAPVADTDNGFVYVLGFGVPASEDPQAAGALRKAWMESANHDPKLIDAEPLKEYANFNASGSRVVDAVKKSCGNDRSAKCRDVFLAALPKPRMTLEDLLLARGELGRFDFHGVLSVRRLASRGRHLVVHTGLYFYPRLPRMQSPKPLVVILATGGTIAGTAAAATDTTGYRAGALGVQALVAGVPALADHRLESEAVAAIDSKDMDEATWQRLAQRAAHHLTRPEVAGVVVTHGTDTLEETAYFLQRVLAPAKPLVLTAAMRPASALSADGPANLLDAVTLAQAPGVRGVSVVFAGAAWAAVGLRKVHTLQTNAFAGSDCGPIARLEGGVLRTFRTWPAGDALGLARVAPPPDEWPRVEIVLNHAAADGAMVDAAVAAGARGLVVAGTGHGSISARLEAALVRARERGVAVRRASRCAFGPVLPKPSSEGDADDESVGELSAVQARVALQLELLAHAQP